MAGHYLKNNLEANRESLLKYLRQVFQTINLANMGRWREDSEIHYKKATHRRRALALGRHQGFVAMKQLEGALVSGETDLGSILARQRSFNNMSKIEGTSVTKMR